MVVRLPRMPIEKRYARTKRPRTGGFFPAILLLLGLAPAAVGSAAVPSLGDATTLTQAERAWIAEHPVVRLMPDPLFPPYEYFDEDGHFLGIGADFVALMEKKLGIRFDVILVENWQEYVAKTKGWENDVWSVVGYTCKWGFGLRADWPELHAILEKGLAQITPKERQAINRKWVAHKEQPWIPTTTFLVSVLGAVAVFIIGGVVVWNRSVKRRIDLRTRELAAELAERERAETTLRERTELIQLLHWTAGDANKPTTLEDAIRV